MKKPLKPVVSLVVVVLLAVLVAACTSDSSRCTGTACETPGVDAGGGAPPTDGGSAGDPDTGPTAPSDCNGMSCDYTTHYCLVAGFRVPMSAWCRPLPAGCHDCACAQSDALSSFESDDYHSLCMSESTSDYFCEQTGDAVVVECYWGN